MDILSLTKQDLIEQVTKLGIKPFVAAQVFDWIYQKYELDPFNMTNISKEFQTILNEKFIFQNFTNCEKLTSSDNLAVKYIFSTKDNLKIETVLLKERKYNTICLSTQIGCNVNCGFCLTGKVGFKRNLTSSEIVAQLVSVLKDHSVSNIVYMGMGEPFLNLDAVLASITAFSSPQTLNISKRRITVSTSGILKGLQKLIDEDIRLNLSFSVGSPDPLRRIILMPIEKTNSIIEVAQLLKSYLKNHNRKLTLEYTPILHQNDSTQELLELANLAAYLNSKINLIQFNEHKELPYKAISTKKIMEMKSFLNNKAIPTTIRFKKGLGIFAACGQLGESLLN